MKKTVVAALSSIALLASLAASATAADSIPNHLNPGTVIQYDSNNNPVVINPGFDASVKSPKTFVSNKAEETKEEKAAEAANKRVYAKDVNIKIDLPKPTPGLTVFYDGLGEPSIFRGGQSASAFTAQPASDQPNLAGQEVYGQFSYYYGVGLKGSDGKVLEDYDVATKLYFDVPPAGTSIQTRNLDNWYLITTYKWDVGTLPHAVLDLEPVAFHDLGGIDDDGYIPNGRYYHN